MGQLLEDVQSATGEVEGVDLERLARGLGGEPGADRERAQGDGLAGPSGAEDEEPAVGVGMEVGERLQLARRLIGHADHERTLVGRARQTPEVVAGGERRQPRSPRRGRAEQAERTPVGGHEPLEVARVFGGDGDPALLRDLGVVVEAEQAHVHRRRLHLGHRVAADVGALERHQLLRPDAGHSPTGQASLDRRRHRGPDHVVRLVVGGHPQGDAQVGVGPDLPGDHPRRTLGGEDEVQAEAAAAQRHVDHPVDELRYLLGERGELVDDDEQAGRRVRMALALHLEKILGVGLLEEQLAVVQLGVQRDQRPSHLVAVEVGHEADRVRQLDALLERGTTLVVDEQERDPLGTVHRGQPGDERLEELALAGAGRAGDEGVRTVLPDVENERCPRLHADDDPQAVPIPAPLVLLPQLEDRRRVVEHVRPTVELGEGHRARDLAVVVHPAGHVDHRREVAGDGDGVGEGQALPAGGADGDAVAGEAGPGGDMVGIDLDHRPARLREPVAGRAHPDEEDAGFGPGFQQRHEAASLERAGLVDQDENGREHHRGLSGPIAVGGRVHPRLEQVVDEAEGVVRGRRQLGAAEPAGVGQPLEELPLAERGFAHQRDHGEIGRAVHRDGLHDQRAGQRPGRREGTGHADPVQRREVEGQGDVVEQAEAPGDLLQLLAQVARAPFVDLHFRARRQLGGAGAQAQEVGVVRRPLPEPVGEAAHEPAQLAGGGQFPEPPPDFLEALHLEVLHLLVDDLLVLGEGVLELVLPSALGLDRAADQQHRREEHEDRAEWADQEVHDDAHHQREHRRDHRQPLPARPFRGGRDLDLDAAVGPVDARRTVELDPVLRGDGFDGAQVVADRQREVAEQGGVARAQERRRNDRRVADDDPVLRAEVGDRDHVADRDAGVMARRLLVLDDDVVVRLATERVVAVAQRVLGLGAVRGGDGKGRAERLRSNRERRVDRVDERQTIARADVDIRHPVVPARRLAGPPRPGGSRRWGPRAGTSASRRRHRTLPPARRRAPRRWSCPRCARPRRRAPSNREYRWPDGATWGTSPRCGPQRMP